MSELTKHLMPSLFSKKKIEKGKVGRRVWERDFLIIN